MAIAGDVVQSDAAQMARLLYRLVDPLHLVAYDETLRHPRFGSLRRSAFEDFGGAANLKI